MKLSWLQTTNAGILIDPKVQAWHSGHVEAILALDPDTLIAGMDSGGVWLLEPGSPPLPLSNDWTSPDVRSLAQGWAGAAHVFAGCLGGLYETDLSRGDPLRSPWKRVDLGGVAGNVLKIAVVPDAGILVLATDQGLSWSRFPSASAGYSWRSAVDLPVGQYSGLAVTTEGVLVAAANPGSSDDVKAGNYGLFRAVLAFEELIAYRVPSPAGLDATKFGRTSIATCRDEPTRVYAVVSNPADDNRVLAVLRSDDSGGNWRAVAVPENASHQGSYNNEIAVSPLRPDLLAIGWSSPGPMISTDGGRNWETPVADSPHWHEDQHAVVFDPFDPQQTRIYFGTDGGIVLTSELGRTFESSYNRYLPTLQFASHPARRGLYGTFAGRGGPPRIVGGGTQDNGDVYCDPSADAWRELLGGDGHGMMYVANGGLVWYTNGSNGTLNAQWDGSKFYSWGLIPNTPVDILLAPVSRPRFRGPNREDLMLGVGGWKDQVFGLFQLGATINVYWRALARFTGLPDILGVGSFTGETVFASVEGTPGVEGEPPGLPPRMFAVDSATGRSTELSIVADFDLTSSGAWEIGQIVIADSGTGFATANNQNLGRGFLLSSKNLLEWRQVDGFPTDQGMVYGVDADWDLRPSEVYAVTDRSVWVSDDAGRTWSEMNDGLPAMPHCAGVQLVQDFRGDAWLHLPTFGRSVWRARIGKDERQQAQWPIRGWSRVSPLNTAPAGSSISAVSRNTDELDVFIVGNDGAIYTGWWSSSVDWPMAGWRRISPRTTAPMRAPVSAVSRNSDQLDVFIVGNDGAVYTGWWNPASDWPVGGWQRISPTATAPVGAGIAAVSRNPDQLDVFIVGNDGAVYTGWWNPASVWPFGGWQRISPTATAPVGAPIAVVSRNPDQLDVFVVGNDGAIYTGGWNPVVAWPVGGWRRISPTTTAPVGGSLAAVCRDPDELDAFIAGNDGGVYTGWWSS
jgi:hypothetical protein